MVYNGGSRCLHFRVKSPRPEVSNIIKDVFESDPFLKDLWVELPTGLGLGVSWNLLWTWSKPRINLTHLLVWQRVNHFEDSKQLTRKDLLKKNIHRFVSSSSLGMSEFDIMPQTFILPHEYTQFVQAFTAFQASANTAATSSVGTDTAASAGSGTGNGQQASQVINLMQFFSCKILMQLE